MSIEDARKELRHVQSQIRTALRLMESIPPALRKEAEYWRLAAELAKYEQREDRLLAEIRAGGQRGSPGPKGLGPDKIGRRWRERL